jgi:hypothetical protein
VPGRYDFTGNKAILRALPAGWIQRNLDDEQMEFQNDWMHQKYISKEFWVQELRIERKACRRLQKLIKRVTLYKHCLKNLCLNLIAG